MENGQVELDGIIIPYCEEGGDKWYPIKYVVEQFLLKSYNHISINDKCKNYIKRYTIDYTFKGTSPQETNCMNKDGWIKYLNECKLNKNKDINELTKHNIFCDYIGCDNKYEIVDKVEYDNYMKYCINNVLENNKDIKCKKCLKCNRELPLHKNFFPTDDRVNIGFTGTCNMCKCDSHPYTHVNKMSSKIYSIYGNQGYLIYKNNNEEFIELYKDKDNFEKLGLLQHENPIIDIDYEKKILLDKIKSDYINCKISELDLDIKTLYYKYETKLNYNQLNNNEINEYCSNSDCKLRPYKYPNYDLGKISYAEGNNILKIYINDNNIIIDNILDYNKYLQLLKQSELTQFIDQGLKFIIQFYNYEYAGYKFKYISNNHYRYKENAIFDMKYFIEKDLKIPIEKAPLYVTKQSLYKNARRLYNTLTKGYIYNNLFEWINDCYPNKFTIYDFEINPFRTGFDSLQESQVDEQLRYKLNNVIYNQRNTDQTVKINGIVPDWVVITTTGCLFIEYFGMYDSKAKTGLTKKYTDRANIKIEKYKKLEKIGYNHLYIFPEDLNNNFEGLKNKLEAI